MNREKNVGLKSYARNCRIEVGDQNIKLAINHKNRGPSLKQKMNFKFP